VLGFGDRVFFHFFFFTHRSGCLQTLHVHVSSLLWRFFPSPLHSLRGLAYAVSGPSRNKVPKLSIEVAGEPFFSHQIRLLKQAGLTRIVLWRRYLGEKIVELYGDGSKWGIQIEYFVRRSPKLLGTGGALIQALPNSATRSMCSMATVFCHRLPSRLRSFFAFGRLGLMTVFEKSRALRRQQCRVRRGEIKVYDKKNKTPAMHHIDYGLACFPAAFDGFSRDAVVDLAAVQSAWSLSASWI